MCYQHAPRPDWVTDVRISASVRTIEDGETWLDYEGRIASEHRVGGELVSVQETKLAGEGTYDFKAERLRSVLLVGPGTLRWPEAPGKLVTFDALVEWALQAPESTSMSRR